MPVKLAFLQQPSNALAGATISPAVQVVVEDNGGNVLRAATNPVTLALVGNSGGLAGTLTATPQNGIATFSDLSVGTAGSGYTLSATSPSLTSATSISFTINAHAGGSRFLADETGFPGAAFECPDSGRDFTGGAGRDRECQRRYCGGRQ